MPKTIDMDPRGNIVGIHDGDAVSPSTTVSGTPLPDRRGDWVEDYPIPHRNPDTGRMELDRSKIPPY